MIRVLAITFSALMLAGCADGFDRSAGIGDCKRSPSANRPVSSMALGFSGSYEPDLAGLPSQTVPGGGREPRPQGTSAYQCVHKENDGGREPQTRDLQKIGAARMWYVPGGAS